MRKLKENVTMSFATTIIAAINVVLAIINVFTDSVFIRGMIWGIGLTVIVLSFVRLGIIVYNEKIDKIKYNKKLGFREDFDWLNKWQLKTKFKGYVVSTVDLGINHNLLGEGKPLYYETMIFNIKNYDNIFEAYQVRYSTKKEAKKGHKEAIKYVKERLKEGN